MIRRTISAALLLLITIGFHLPAHLSFANDITQTVTNKTQQTVRVFGKVIGMDGKPAGDVKVSLKTEVYKDELMTVETQSVITDNNGEFQFHAKAIEDKTVRRFYTVFAETENSAGVPLVDMNDFDKGDYIKEPLVIHLVPKQNHSIKLLLDDKPAQHIKVAILYISSVAQKENRFGLYPNDYQHDNKWVCETNDKGEATFTGVPKGYGIAYDVLDKKYTMPTSNLRSSDGDTFLIYQGGTIEGSILSPDHKTSVANITCQANEYKQGVIGGSATTDDNGNFSIKRLKPGKYALSANLSKAISKEWAAKPIRNVVVKPGEVTKDATITLLKGALITGKVTIQDTKTPIPGITIAAFASPIHTVTATDKDGRYAFKVYAGAIDLTAMSRDFMGGYKHITVENDKTYHVDFQLYKNGSIEGKLNCKDKTVSLSGIRCIAEDATERYITYERTTDANGNYKIDGLKPGNYQMRIALSNDLNNKWIVKTKKQIKVMSGKATHVNLELTSGAYITGRLTVLETNRPAANIQVSIQSGNVFIGNTITDKNGTYTFCVEDGVYAIAPLVNDVYYISKTVTVKAAGDTVRLDMKVDQEIPKKPVTGIVVDEYDKPVANADIIAYPHRSMAAKPVTVKTDIDGCFTIEADRIPSKICLQASSGKDAVEKSLIAIRGQYIKLKLKHNAMISVKGVICDENKHPLSEAIVTLSQYIDSYYRDSIECTTDSMGVYHFEDLYPGASYMVQATKMGYSKKTTDLYDTKAGESYSNDLEIRKADSYAAGILINKKKKPLPFTKLSCTEDSTNTTYTTDKNGKFRIEAVPQGEIELYVNLSDTLIGATATGGRNDNVVVVNDASITEQKKEQNRFTDRMNKTNEEELNSAKKLGHAPSYDDIMNKAKTNAKKRNVNILMVFHSSWCGPCHILLNHLRSAKVIKIIESRFEFVVLDVWEKDDKKIMENLGASDKIAKLGGDRYIPYTVLIDPNEKVLGKQTGVPTSPGQIDTFLSILQKNSKLTDEEVKVMHEELMDR